MNPRADHIYAYALSEEVNLSECEIFQNWQISIFIIIIIIIIEIFFKFL